MTALFPTYTNLWQRAKRLLATDLNPHIKRFLEHYKVDTERYQRELESLGLDRYQPFF